MLIIIIAIIAIILIIPVVLVTGLVVVGLGMQTMNQGTAIPEVSSKTAWKSTEPFGIVDWSHTNSTTMTIVLKNNTADTLTLNKMNLTSSIQNTEVAQIPAYGTKVITFTTPNCSAGSKYAYSKSGISISYVGSTIPKTVFGIADIVGTCVFAN